MTHLINISNLKKNNKFSVNGGPELLNSQGVSPFSVEVIGLWFCSTALQGAVEILMVLSYAEGVLYK